MDRLLSHCPRLLPWKEHIGMTTTQLETLTIPAEAHPRHDLLDELTELAVRMDFLLARIEEHRNTDPAALQAVLQRMAWRLDDLYQRAVHGGISLNTPLATQDRRGKSYELLLTHEGVEYRVA